MKITIEGTNQKGNEQPITIEYLGETQWELTIGNTTIATMDLEKSMAFLKEDFNKAEKK